MNKKYLMLALFALAAMLFAFDVSAAQHLNPDTLLAGAMTANVAVAALPEAINAELKKIGDQLRAQAEAAEKEIKAHAKLSEETKATVDKLLISQGELQANLQNAEQKLAMLETDGIGVHRGPKSMGEQVGEDEGYKAWAANPTSAKIAMTVKNVITEGDGSAGDLIVPHRVPGVFQNPMRRLTIRDLITWGLTSGPAVEFVRENVFTNNAAPVSENPSGTKPESNITYEADQVPVATIAHWIHASKQVLSDIPMLRSLIDGRLRSGLKLKEEDQLLKGSGVGLNIDGIYTQATAYSQPSGAAVVNENFIDRLRLAMLQVALAEYAADAIVLHPTDWTNIELLKTSTEHAYLFGNPHTLQVPALWGLPVVATTAMSQGTFLTGVFGNGLAVQGWDREDVTITVATQDDRDFVKNMVKILCEERAALTVYRPQAFVKGSAPVISV